MPPRTPPASTALAPGGHRRPRPLLPHEKAALRLEVPHPATAFPLMAPASAQGAPSSASPRLDQRIDALLGEAQAALDRMRARAAAAREALLEARAAPSGPARVHFVVPSPDR